MMGKKNLGGSFDEFLEDEGLLEETTAAAVKRYVAFELSRKMSEENISKTDMAKLMETSRSALDRLLDPENSSVTLQTLQNAARPDFKKFKEKALEHPEVAEEYERLSPAYELRRKLLALRQEAGLTQEQVADLLNTKKSNISRLESVNSSISPKLSTIEDYAEAMGYSIKIDFVPKQTREHNQG
jgi:transcriptional regulator with XRE-family HTH domain